MKMKNCQNQDSQDSRIFRIIGAHINRAYKVSSYKSASRASNGSVSDLPSFFVEGLWEKVFHGKGPGRSLVYDRMPQCHTI